MLFTFLLLLKYSWSMFTKVLLSDYSVREPAPLWHCEYKALILYPYLKGLYSHCWMATVLCIDWYSCLSPLVQAQMVEDWVLNRAALEPWSLSSPCSLKASPQWPCRLQGIGTSVSNAHWPHVTLSVKSFFCFHYAFINMINNILHQ